MTERTRPIHSVEILVLPNFSHLTLASVIEPMRVANKVTRRALFDDIARRVGIGTRELQRRFRAHLGTSPLRFFNEMRLGLAYRLLEHTDRTVNDIAVATGFGSGSAFARAFRARFGRPPTSLRDRGQSR